MVSTESSAPVRSYFVDEAGDGTLFDRKGRVIVGREGCSRFFMLGLADIEEPAAVGAELSELRTRLLADPYFMGVPSIRSEAHKTALAFHATDDLPEVRREVFTLLLQHKIHFFAVVRDKQKVVEYARQRRDRDAEYHYHPDELYDSLIERLFRGRLHRERCYRICFATRGRCDRTAALRGALEQARAKFKAKWAAAASARTDVLAVKAAECDGVQVADYLLWALQRLYERHEERFLHFIWDRVTLVHDVDDTRRAPWGMYYTKKKPLSLAALVG